MAEHLILKTWDEWESEGFHVIRGERATAYINGTAAFTDKQVAKTHYYRSWDEARAAPRPAKEKKPRTVYFADGSGYVDYGGPGGPLYFDKFGNT